MIKKAMLVIVVIFAIGYAALSAKPPKEFVLQTPRLDEASGVDLSQINKDILWSHNDSGGKAAVYALNSKGDLVCTLELKGITNRDWEDIAVAKDPKTGKSHIYIGEIGDNGAQYGSIKIYKVAEPTLNPADTLIITDEIETIEINYADGAKDAEALFIEPKTGDIYILSKREEKVGLYHVSSPYSTSGINTAKRIADLPLGWVTAADIADNGKSLLVKTYTCVFRFKTKLDKDNLLSLSETPKALPYKLEPQGEALCFDAKNKGYYTLSEAAEDTPQVLYFYKR